eukprot:CAMPEP_0117698248 /NCGR_PEP_ID=MMETSP0804-20121206/29662_1 /TAXON_ID=1074897 /ORGANISM="Tetraselmis astigmatica, Strain CCMP880" /LENGTH=335 /DNA_ID=CAMNT_0005512555 /DNA_START=30 /DNA_END=1038 /DNA_ORIENTATION=+
MGIFTFLLALLASLLSWVWVASFVSPTACTVLQKLLKFGYGFATMLLSTDKRWKKLKIDPEMIQDATEVTVKRIIFIRHGESDWNEVFNRGFGPSFPIRLLSAIARELALLVTEDSVFIDSALSPLGINQARELVKFLEESPTAVEDTAMHSVLRGDGDDVKKSDIKLAEALATAAVGLQRRLKLTGEKILIASDLQEVTFNLDGNALARAGGVPDLHAIKPEMWSSYEPASLFDPSLNKGDKPMFGNGLERMLRFCDLVFARNESTIIAIGHSLYFRSFFRSFLPSSCAHTAKTKKMVNAGTVAFDLSRGNYQGKTLYWIDPASVSVVYGGFSK